MPRLTGRKQLLGLASAALAVAGIAYGSIKLGYLSPDTASANLKLSGQVVGIVDGDTFKLKAGPKVFTIELIGIDAPEFGQKFGEIAGEYLADLIEHRSVTLRAYDTNQYGDFRGELFLDGISINKLLLTDGYAWADRNGFEDSDWVGLEHLARDKGFGLWRYANAMPPWEYRKIPVHLMADG